MRRPYRRRRPCVTRSRAAPAAEDQVELRVPATLRARDEPPSEASGARTHTRGSPRATRAPDPRAPPPYPPPTAPPRWRPPPRPPARRRPPTPTRRHRRRARARRTRGARMSSSSSRGRQTRACRGTRRSARSCARCTPNTTHSGGRRRPGRADRGGRAAAAAAAAAARLGTPERGRQRLAERRPRRQRPHLRAVSGRSASVRAGGRRFA